MITSPKKGYLSSHHKIVLVVLILGFILVSACMTYKKECKSLTSCGGGQCNEEKRCVGSIWGGYEILHKTIPLGSSPCDCI